MLDKLVDLTKPFANSMQYPKEYNPKVHGAFNPAINYGKGKPFKQLFHAYVFDKKPNQNIFVAEPLLDAKVGELGSWLSRRNFSLANIRAASSRLLWQYRMKYIAPKRANGAAAFHFIFFAFTINYFLYEHPDRSKKSEHFFFTFILPIQ
jgi:hypothetical protein